MTLPATGDAATFLLPVFLLCAAPFIGSFVGSLAIRLVDGRPLLWGRSACDACGTSLGALDLVPLVSWAAAAGRCRHCRARIGLFYPLVEIAAIIIVLWAATETSGVVLAAGCLLGWTLLALGLIDWRAFLLPDVLTLGLVLSGVSVAYLLDRANLVDHLLGAAAGFLLFAGIAMVYRMVRGTDGLGLGDAKLLAGAGAWLTWQALPTVVLIGASIGLAYMLVGAAAGHALHAKMRVPFGTFLAAAVWLVWLYGPVSVV